MKSNLNEDWLAGFIDGDGCFLVSPAGYASLEITVARPDLPMLLQVQKAYGGSVKFRAGSRSVRYRCTSKPDLLKLICAVNGRIRNNIRHLQHTKVCNLYGVDVANTIPYSWNSAYACGLFDSDGTIVLSVKKHNANCHNVPGVQGKKVRLEHALSMQLTLSITQKYRENLIFLNTPIYQEKPFGMLRYDKSQNGSYIWYVTSRKDVLELVSYFERHASLSVRSHRLALVKTYFELIDARCHVSTRCEQRQRWLRFAADWHFYDI